MDSTTRYRRLNSGPAGRIRELAISLLVPQAEHLPTRTTLREAVEEALPGDAYAEARAAIIEKLVAVARMGVGGVDRLEAHDVINTWTLKLADELEAEDALLPSTSQDASPEEVRAAADAAMSLEPGMIDVRGLPESSQTWGRS